MTLSRVELHQRRRARAQAIAARTPRFSAQAGRDYVARPFEDHNWLKEVPHVELVAEVARRGFRLHTPPWTHQLACLLLGAKYPHFNFYLDMGAGKTKLMLDLFRWRRARGEVRRGLVVLPERIHVTAWTEQVATHAPDLRVEVLLGTREERYAALRNLTADLYIINHKGLEVYMSARAGRRQVLVPAAAAEFAAQFDFLIYEEIHRIKTHTSLLFAACSALSAQCPYRYALTGTPFGRDPAALWPQWQLVDRGETLGPRALFRAVFFNAHLNYWAGIEYVFRKDRTELLRRALQHRSIVYAEEELTALPQQLSVRVPVEFSEEGAMYYRRILDRVKELRGDYRSLDSVYIRMRQCASGFLALRTEDGEEEERLEVRFRENPKLEALRALITDRIGGRKFIVYHHFIYSGRMICELLDELKVKYASVRGGVRDVQAEFRRFIEEPECRALVANTRMGSEAINPQAVCHIEIYFESPDDPITRTQAERRIRRSGQPAPHVLIYDLVVRGTIEEKLLHYHHEGRTLLKAVLEGKESLD